MKPNITGITEYWANNDVTDAIGTGRLCNV